MWGERPRETVTVGLDPDQVAALDRFAAEEGLSREDALRLILSDWFIGHGYRKPEPEE